MNSAVFLSQLLNGLQFGVLLFLLSAGLTLVLGIMNFVNLTHGAMYMLGAYLAATIFVHSGSFLLAGAGAVAGTAFTGVILERLVFAGLYRRDHLDQVLATFGLILFANEVMRIFWGPGSIAADVPPAFADAIDLFGLPYPTYRFAIIGVGLGVAIGLYLLINRTRLGILIRAGASNPQMIAALGVNVRLLNTAVVGLGAALAGLAGLMAGPITSVQPGMGEPILIMTLVVIVTGGIGSVRGAFYGALIVGVIDTLGRVILPMLLREVVDRTVAQATGPAIASMLIYIVMAAVLAYRPQGLFPVRHG